MARILGDFPARDRNIRAQTWALAAAVARSPLSFASYVHLFLQGDRFWDVRDSRSFSLLQDEPLADPHDQDENNGGDKDDDNIPSDRLAEGLLRWAFLGVRNFQAGYPR